MCVYVCVHMCVFHESGVAQTGFEFLNFLLQPLSDDITQVSYLLQMILVGEDFY